MSDEATRIMSDAEMNAADRLAEERLFEGRARSADPDLERRVADLLARPYRLEIRGDAREGYLARAPELPGCVTAGTTPEEALAALRDAMESWLAAAIAADEPIPEPDPAADDRPSGRLLIRMAKSLHAAILETAQREGVSANQYVVTALAAAVSRGMFAAPEFHPREAEPGWWQRPTGHAIRPSG